MSEVCIVVYLDVGSFRAKVFHSTMIDIRYLG